MAFLLFTPRKRWQATFRNLRVGDVVMLLSTGKLSPGTYRLGMVRQVMPDTTGVVRTVLVGLRSRRRRGAGAWVEEQRMAVQRLAVLLPVEERWEQGLAVPAEE